MTDTTNDMMDIGGTAFTLRPLTLGAIRKNQLPSPLELVSGIGENQLPDDAQLDAIIKIVHASISVATPGYTFQQFVEHVEEMNYLQGVQTMIVAFARIMTISGFSQIAKMGDRFSGEAAEAREG